VQTANTGKQHFPFATDNGQESGGYWPTTALSYAPAAAGAAGLAFQSSGN
jgi:hypothetical protein